MAFVARNDQHGNEIMRVMLSPEPGQRTVATCQNLRINCVPSQPLDADGDATSDGRFDHRQRFHPYAVDAEPSEIIPAPQRERNETQQQQQTQLESMQHHNADESAAWHTDEITAHSTLVNPIKVQLEKPAEKRRDFHCWLAAKNEAQQRESQDRRLAAQQEDQRAAERARLATQQFEEWCVTKSTQMRRAKSDLSSVQPTTPSLTNSQSSEAQQQQRHNEWERGKLAALKAQREERKARDKQQELLESTRRERNAEAVEQWMDASRSRPRPVPMGKGLDSLRASMAPLYTNPNEWQTLLPQTSRRQQQPQQQQSHEQQQHRTGPDYERLERLAQPRRQLNPSPPAAVSLKTQPELRRQSSAPEADWLSISSETLHATQVEKRGKPIIWSNRNAQRVRELREVLNPLDEPVPRQLRDDQLEKLRQQQNMQNTKILPRKYQQKREQLREKLKPWVEAGKLQPDRGALTYRMDNNKSKVETTTTAQRSEHHHHHHHHQAAAATSLSSMQRTRSNEMEERQLKQLRDSKTSSKSRPWR
ncbi:trichohyalin-like isoform X1 [Drosophila nasuta]|uniref:trichohyalin-like isoform X1 n=2 Tax=Drosophila nasuta TaxID=42062 RepID=UPI00295E870B|nr:trichohyalin-like isoform X1 [Drosophila nasuta]